MDQKRDPHNLMSFQKNRPEVVKKILENLRKYRNREKLEWLRQKKKEKNLPSPAIFDPNKDTLDSGQAFNEDTYAQAKPYFENMLQAAVAAGYTLKQLVSHIYNSFGEGVRPYLRRFLQEQAQKSLEKPSEASINKKNQTTPEGRAMKKEHIWMSSQDDPFWQMRLDWELENYPQRTLDLFNRGKLMEYLDKKVALANVRVNLMVRRGINQDVANEVIQNDLITPPNGPAMKDNPPEPLPKKDQMRIWEWVEGLSPEREVRILI